MVGRGGVAKNTLLYLFAAQIIPTTTACLVQESIYLVIFFHFQ